MKLYTDYNTLTPEMFHVMYNTLTKMLHVTYGIWERIKHLNMLQLKDAHWTINPRKLLLLHAILLLWYKICLKLLDVPLLTNPGGMFRMCNIDTQISLNLVFLTSDFMNCYVQI